MSEHDHAYVDPLVHVAQLDHPDRLADARASAGKAIRDLGHAIVGHHAPLELIDRVSTTLDALRAELSTLPVRTAPKAVPKASGASHPKMVRRSPPTMSGPSQVGRVRGASICTCGATETRWSPP